MGTKKKTKGAPNHAAEAARRAAAAQRIGPKPARTPKPYSGLKALQPPGHLYQDWTQADPRLQGVSLEDALAQFEGSTVDQHRIEVTVRYAEIYGVGGIPEAAFTLDTAMRDSGRAAQSAKNTGITAEEALKQFHILHATGLLLVADDGGIWTSVPPTAAADGRWHLDGQLPLGDTPAA